MSSRDEILARVRRNQPEPRDLPRIPAFDGPPGALVDAFKAGVLRMGGKIVEAPVDGDLDALVTRLFPDATVICSATPEVKGTRALDPEAAPATLDDVDVGVVRALYGIAETGSLCLTTAQFGVSALGFLAQHLVVLLDPGAIVPGLHDAYGRRADFDAPYTVFMTGPSATADIEGVLIHGAQGIRTLTVVPVAAP
jgi:L-lactate dehydrogenase complex protein LldG